MVLKLLGSLYKSEFGCRPGLPSNQLLSKENLTLPVPGWPATSAAPLSPGSLLWQPAGGPFGPIPFWLTSFSYLGPVESGTLAFYVANTALRHASFLFPPPLFLNMPGTCLFFWGAVHFGQSQKGLTFLSTRFESFPGRSVVPHGGGPHELRELPQEVLRLFRFHQGVPEELRVARQVFQTRLRIKSFWARGVGAKKCWGWVTRIGK